MRDRSATVLADHRLKTCGRRLYKLDLNVVDGNLRLPHLPHKSSGSLVIRYNTVIKEGYPSPRELSRIGSKDSPREL